MCMKKTEAMVCTLRELVTAQYAANRAWAEFYQSLGGVTAEQNSALRAAIVAWIDAEEVDPRAIDVGDLHDVLSAGLLQPAPAAPEFRTLRGALREFAKGGALQGDEYARALRLTDNKDVRHALVRMMHREPKPGDAETIRAFADNLKG